MNMFQCQQIISGPNDGQPFESHGKTNYVTEWVANGLVNGMPFNGLNVRAVWQSPKNQMFYINAMNNGEPIEYMQDDFNGQSRIKIMKPKQEQQGQQRGYQQQSQPMQPKPMQGQPVQQQHVKALPFNAMHRLMDLCIAETEKSVYDGDLIAMAAALFSGCVSGHIAFPQTKTQNNQAMQKQLDEQATMDAINAAGLKQRFDVCEAVDLAKAVELWKASQGNAQNFAVTLNSALQMAMDTENDAGIDDNGDVVPF